ncbi:hypothetical protein ACP70R_047397 [Stipagrostis hirtigluma subsp. patula]
MALVDLNRPPDDDDDVPVRDLNNEAVHMHGEGTLDHPFDLNIAPAQDGEHGSVGNLDQEIALDNDFVGGNRDDFPFDLNNEHVPMDGEGTVDHPFDLNIAPGQDEINEIHADLQQETGDWDSVLQDYSLYAQADGHNDNMHPDGENGTGANLEQEIAAMEEQLHDYGVFAETVDVVFDEEELSDSEDEQYCP